MDMEKMLEEYRQAQRIRIISKLAKKTMAAFVQFKNVVVQKGSGPRFQEVTREIRKGSPPDLGVIVFYNNTDEFHLIIVGSFIFNEKLPCDKELKIIFTNGEKEDINLSFATKNLKDECAAALINYLDLR
jgi:hypothetical protein